MQPNLARAREKPNLFVLTGLYFIKNFVLVNSTRLEKIKAFIKVKAT